MTDGKPTKATAQALGKALAADAAAAELAAHQAGQPVDLFGQAPADPARAGRPAGATNKRTEETSRYIRETFGDPLIADAKLASTPVEIVQARLSCTALEAMDVIAKARGRLLPYVHQRLPQAVQIDGEISTPAEIVLSATVAKALGLDLAGVRVIDEDGNDIEENQ